MRSLSIFNVGTLNPPFKYFREVIEIHIRAVKAQLKTYSEAHKLILFKKQIITKENTL